MRRRGVKVTEVDIDRGHFTFVDEEDGLFHTYVIGVECRQRSDSITLLYEDRIPDGLVLSIGDQLTIESDTAAEYDTDWKGFWIRDLKIRKE